ncbi:MAG: dTDP-4-amino-4,6-dideoxygalactose transaminase [Cyclobacteriaceae bacterium]|nr:dTDP-4-amino-4,6-dideoxygalactose transaminase [Cyclobacteriaceae bacterium]
MNQNLTPFNKPFLTGNELTYISEALYSGKISGNGQFTKKVQDFFEKKYGFKKCLLTSSCTDALEMAAILIDIKPGDEVIIPSYTFVSTANPFVLRGAKIIFVDSRPDHPGMNEDAIEELITSRTRAIVAVHYAGVSCDMDKIGSIAERYNLFVVEDAAQAIDSYFIDKNGIHKPLGSIGHLATFSFHETKNIISGEGGMLVINSGDFEKRAEIIWEKGTNRSAFFRGEVDKYGWVDIGSSFLPSEVTAAFLMAQAECIEKIQDRRIGIWNYYQSLMMTKDRDKKFITPYIPKYATNNAHMYYLICHSASHRDNLIKNLKNAGYWAVSHYISLHSSPYYKRYYKGLPLINADLYTERLLRLPMFYDLENRLIDEIVDIVLSE